jgi:ABC-2 type transport system ATP-binding protein
LTAIEVRGLRKSYGEVEAVRGVDFDVATRETFGFLGPNGAGKSTTIKILCTLARADGGTASVAGYDVATQRDDVRRNIGLVFQDTTLDGYLSAEQNLRFHAELYGMPRETVQPRMQQVLEMVGLWERRASKVLTFSGGMKRRLEIARGLMHSPRVLFLDEPTVGLDPQTRASIWEYIGQLREQEDITIFLTTHYMDEAEHCDRIAIMDAGQLVALDLRAIKIVVQRDLIRTYQDKTRFISALIQPVLFLFVLGSGLSSLTGGSTGPIDLRTFMFPGILATSTLFTAMFSAMSIVWDREFGFLREMLVAPVRRSSIILGKALGGATIASLQGVVVMLLGLLVHVPYTPGLVVVLLAEVFLLSFTLTAFGLAIVARITQVQTVMGLMQMLLLPLSFLSGALYPLSNLPAWLSVLTRLNPLTYAVHPIRTAVFGHLDLPDAVRARLNPPLTWFGWEVPTGMQLGLVAALGAVLLGVAVRQFQKVE